MSAVWLAARAAVGRRKLQTIVIGIVVWASTATIVMALGLLDSAAAPFDRAFAQQNGAHLVAAFDRTKVSDTQLTRSAEQSAAVAGPFGTVTLDTSESQFFLGTLNTVGRADPGGPVDRVDVWQGRWANAPGEIVLNRAPGLIGQIKEGFQLRVAGRPVLTVVGFGYSVSASADAWVTPSQLEALQPTGFQMLYRFANAATAADISAGQTAVTAGLAPEALLGSLSYLTVRDKATSEIGVFVPFLMIFGILGLTVAVLIVANVVSGAVVAGFRHIGVLKALGFTANQVMAVYLLMVSIPAVIGCVLGTISGNLLTGPIVQDAVEGFGLSDISFAPWVNILALLGMPALVALTAFLPALRARRLSAAQAISAGSTQHIGRALRIQRWLSGTRLPRSVSLGLGVPFARPARSVLTLAAVVLGVMTVTLAVGVTMSMTAYNNTFRPSRDGQVELLAGRPIGGPVLMAPGEPAPSAPRLSDAEDEAMLRSLPGAAKVLATARFETQVAGGTQNAELFLHRGDTAELGPKMASGHWPDGPGQVAVPSRFLNQRGLKVGDTITVELRGRKAALKIVGITLTNNADQIFANWDTQAALAPDTRAHSYRVQLQPGTERQSYLAAVQAKDPGLRALPPVDGTSSVAVIIISAASALTLLLGAVAALGVFNTVILNARERRRDLGMLKSIGMTPRQVTVMMVTSMGALGLVGGLVGLPFGVAVHRLVVPAMAQAGQSDVLDIFVDVYHVPALALLAFAGIFIAVFGALIPARGAARISIAAVLHNE